MNTQPPSLCALFVVSLVNPHVPTPRVANRCTPTLLVFADSPLWKPGVEFTKAGL